MSDTEPADARDATLAAIRDVLSTIARPSFDLVAVLDTVIHRAMTLTGADHGNIAVRRGDAYRVLAIGGLSDEYLEAARGRDYRAERGSIIGRALLERRAVHVDDVTADPEYALHELQRIGHFRTVLGVPLMSEGDAVGALAVGRTKVAPFSEEERALATFFADQAAVAVRIASLFDTVERQRSELARFAPQVASLLSSSEGEQLLSGHRREISVLFADLRGFTSFAEAAEPEEVLGVLREYHATCGRLITSNGGTVEHFAGDGLMAFYNDPAPLPDHGLAAARTAMELRTRFDELAAGWRRRGYELGLGIGIALGYATLGRIGFEGRYDYGAVGNAVILASRLSDAAAAGEILVSQRLNAALDGAISAEPVEGVELKGLSRPGQIFRLRPMDSGRPGAVRATA